MATIGDDCDEAQSDRKKSKSCKQALKEIYDLKIDSNLGKFSKIKLPFCKQFLHKNTV